MIEIKTALLIRNLGFLLIICAATKSIVSSFFVEKGTTLAILLYPLFFAYIFMLPAPFLAKACPKCSHAFFGRWLSIDIFRSDCKNCGFKP